MFPIKFFEWRRIHGTWHIFAGQESICRRAKSNGDFQAAEGRPPKAEKACSWCDKEGLKIKERINGII